MARSFVGTLYYSMAKVMVGTLGAVTVLLVINESSLYKRIYRLL